MKVTKWVDFGTEVEIDIDLRDVSAAIGEAFARAEPSIDGESPYRGDVAQALVRTITYLKAMTDEQISVLNEHQRKLIADTLVEQGSRFYSANAVSTQ